MDGMIPDAEKVVGAHLRQHSEIEALDVVVVGQTPKNTTGAWVRMTQLDAINRAGARADYLTEFPMQFDCYASHDGIDGSQQAEANLIARTVRAVLHQMPEQSFDAVVVTDARFGGMMRLPDADVDDPARERFILTGRVTMHPIL